MIYRANSYSYWLHQVSGMRTMWKTTDSGREGKTRKAFQHQQKNLKINRQKERETGSQLRDLFWCLGCYMKKTVKTFFTVNWFKAPWQLDHNSTRHGFQAILQDVLLAQCFCTRCMTEVNFQIWTQTLLFYQCQFMCIQTQVIIQDSYSCVRYSSRLQLNCMHCMVAATSVVFSVEFS